MKGKYLITTDNWFYGPDGGQYRAVWGEVQIIQGTFLGIKTNARSANWYVKVGPENNHVIVAGCQIHYAVACEKEPEPHAVLTTIKEEIVRSETTKNVIYLAK
jgi:hypothetical protein